RMRVDWRSCNCIRGDLLVARGRAEARRCSEAVAQVFGREWAQCFHGRNYLSHGKFDFDRSEIKAPLVLQNALKVRRRVIPAMSRRPRAVAAATRGHEVCRTSLERPCCTGLETGLGQNEIDPCLRMVRDTKIVQRDGEEEHVCCDQLIGKFSGE